MFLRSTKLEEGRDVVVSISDYEPKEYINMKAQRWAIDKGFGMSVEKYDCQPLITGGR